MDEQEKVFCRYCGKQIDTDAIFCNHCGKAQVVETVEPIATKHHGIRSSLKVHKKGLRRILWGILSLLIIGILIVCGMYGYDYYKYTYLPEKQEKEAYDELVQKFQTANEDMKLDIALEICKRDEDSYSKFKMDGLLNTERFYYYIVTRAKNGNAKAQYMYGTMLSECNCFNRKFCFVSNHKYYMPDADTTCYAARTVYWFDESAKNGYPKACSEIGKIYEEGIGVDTNLNKAIDFYKKGAALNDVQSQYRLGCMYRDGVVVENDWHWETKTTTNTIDNKDVLIREYWDSEKGTDVYIYREKETDYETLVPKDINKAKYWWRKASEQGCEDATIALQQLYD